MRIFCAVRHATSPAAYYGALWSSNFYPALRELGHEVIESSADLFPLSRFMHIADGFTAEELRERARVTEEILDEIRRLHSKEPIDLFLSYFYNAHFDPAGFDVIRALGIRSVNFYCNSIYQFDLVASIARAADFSWHAERDAARLYRAAGANPLWVQMAADPRVYRPVPGVARQEQACFVGQRYADRDRWMSEVIDAGIPVQIFGPGWQSVQQVDAGSGSATRETEYLGRKLHDAGTAASYLMSLVAIISRDGLLSGIARARRQWAYREETRRLLPKFQPYARGGIPFERITEVFASFEVCLNFSNVWADGKPGAPLIPHVRLRDFEAPMCRTCYLTAHTDEIAEFYAVGKEIDTYRNPEELIDKIRYYLKHRSAAEALREAGYRRALRDHTWRRRFEQLFSLVEGK